MKLESFCEEDTERIAMEIGKTVKPGMVLCLDGDLGTGKTVFAKGIAKGLGINEAVTSPTFSIVQEYYDGRIPLYHFDVYRIGSAEEMDDLGFDEYLFGEGICLIEWSDRIKEALPEHYMKIHVEKELEKGVSYRKIVIEEI